MKKISSVALVLAVLAVFGTTAPVHAACTYDPALVWHGLGFSFTNCTDAQPVNGYVYEVASAATVTTPLAMTDRLIRSLRRARAGARTRLYKQAA